MKKNFVLLTVFVFVFLLTNIFASVSYSLPVIPWRVGFGMDTPAGSGRHLVTPSTNVIKVTNLNDSGAGSLRDAIENKNSPKVIIFEVSGTIELSSRITVGGFTGNDAETKGSYMTIAGQTAPSPGITIKGKPFKIERNCHDILIQHIRFRHGDKNLVPEEYETWDTFIMDAHYRTTPPAWSPPHNIVIDHCSFSWAVDETIESGANDMSFTNNIVSEALNSNLHPKGPHSKGFLGQTLSAGQSNNNLFFANNLISHNVDRNPWIKGGKVVIANNLIYDYKYGIYVSDPGSIGPIKASIVGNYLKETATTEKWSMYMVAGTSTASRIYLADGDPDAANYWAGIIQTNPWNPTGGYFRSCDYWTPCDNPVPEINRATSPPVWPTGYTAMSAADARTYVLANAGARPADRDSVDTRVVYQAENETKPNGGIIASQDDVGGWPNLAQNTRSLTVPANPNEVQPSGYTKLEEWLHGFSRTVEGGGISPPRNLRVL